MNGLLFKLVKLTRAVRIFFGGFTEMEQRWRLFQLERRLTPREISKRLIPLCYQYNALSTTYRKQIWTARKLTDVNHQIHLRFYGDGWVTGHYELQPEMWLVAHLKGRELRALTETEKQELDVLL
jgi:hypothetical protein